MENSKIILVSAKKLKDNTINKLERLFRFHEFVPKRHRYKNIEDIGEFNLLFITLDFKREIPLFGKETSENLSWLEEQDTTGYDVVFLYNKTKYKNSIEESYKVKKLGHFKTVKEFKKMVLIENNKEEMVAQEVEIKVGSDEESDEEKIPDVLSLNHKKVLKSVKEIESQIKKNDKKNKKIKKYLNAIEKEKSTLEKKKTSLQNTIVRLKEKKKSTKNVEKKKSSSFGKKIKDTFRKKKVVKTSEVSKVTEIYDIKTRGKKGIYKLFWKVKGDDSPHEKHFKFEMGDNSSRKQAWSKLKNYEKKLLNNEMSN